MPRKKQTPRKGSQLKNGEQQQQQRRRRQQQEEEKKKKKEARAVAESDPNLNISRITIVTTGTPLFISRPSSRVSDFSVRIPNCGQRLHKY